MKAITVDDITQIIVICFLLAKPVATRGVLVLIIGVVANVDVETSTVVDGSNTEALFMAILVWEEATDRSKELVRRATGEFEAAVARILIKMVEVERACNDSVERIADDDATGLVMKIDVVVDRAGRLNTAMREFTFITGVLPPAAIGQIVVYSATISVVTWLRGQFVTVATHAVIV